MNIDVNLNVISNNCSLLYFGRFLAKNILSINLKVHFPRGRVGVLQNTARDESFHSDALSEIDFIYSTKKSLK